MPGAAGARGAEPAAIMSPEELWRDFDPEALPLDEQPVRRFDHAGIDIEAVRFTGEVVDGAKISVFALRGAPADGKNLPGVLHIHGGGQTASADWVAYWVKRRYVCVSFDYCGPWANRTEFTDWGPVNRANMAQAQGGLQVRPSPRESSWFHWALVARRALTLLARHPQVDRQKLGVFGISTGGSLTWMVAGSDPRVKAAVPIYGCGYNYDRRNVRWGQAEPNDDLRLFQRVVSPEAHAPYIRCPVFFLNSTNDFHGPMDRAYEALGAVPAPVWQAFTPRDNHHIEPRQGRDLQLWMDWRLKDGRAWPATPDLRIGLDLSGVPTATAVPDVRDEVELVELFYALGDKRPQARFWRRTEAARRGDVWEASLPLIDPWDDLYAFANVTYRSGVCLSSPLRHAIPAQLGKARATLSWSDRMEQGLDGLDHWYFPAAYTDPNLDWTFLKRAKDDAVGSFITFDPQRLGDPMDVRLATHLIGDPQFQGKSGMALSFACRGEFLADGLTVKLIEDDWGPRSASYTAVVPASSVGPGWREVALKLDQFQSADGRAPTSWKAIDKLELSGKAGRAVLPGFSRLRWVPDRTANNEK